MDTTQEDNKSQEEQPLSHIIVVKEDEIILLKKLQFIVHFECISIYISDKAKAFKTHNGHWRGHAHLQACACR